MSVPRISLGKQSDGAYGLRISKPGYNVRTNPVDNEQLHFNSDWGASMPIWAQFQMSIPAVSSGYSPVYTGAFSALPYIPVIIITFARARFYDLFPGNNISMQYVVFASCADRLLVQTNSIMGDVVLTATVTTLEAFS